MATITARVWLLSMACCLAAPPLTQADSTPPPDLDELTQPGGPGGMPDQLPHYVILPEPDAAAILERAIAQAPSGSSSTMEANGDGNTQDTVETTVQDSIQGSVWLLVVFLGLMILAGLNSRKPRPPQHSMGAGRRRLGHGHDAAESDDARWDQP